MALTPLTVATQAPKAEDFIALRQSVGWPSPELILVKKSIEQSLFWATIMSEQRLIACARVVGDGQMYFYIQDVIVHPMFERQGLGTRLMLAIESYLSKASAPGATIGLLAALGKETFYQRFGYTTRDGKQLGLAMCKFIN